MASTLEQFLIDFKLDDEYEAWKADKKGLTEIDFLQSLNGMDGQQDLGQPTEPFWVSCLAIYEKNEDEDVEFRPLIHRIVLPTGVFIENSRQLKDSGAASIKVSSSKPIEIRSEVDGFMEAVNTIDVFVLNGVKGSLAFAPIDNMNIGGKQHKLYIPKGSVVNIEWAEEPEESIEFAFTLEMQKVKDTPRDTAILNSVSGWFYVEDSINGFLLDGAGNKLLVELGGVLFHMKYDILMNRQGDFNKWFNDVYTVNATPVGFHRFPETGGFAMQEHIFAIKNKSNVSRTLVITPATGQALNGNPAYGWAGLKKPPQNMTKEGNSWAISFSPNQGEVGAL